MQVKTIQAEYIRDYSNLKSNEVIVKKGGEYLSIEQFALNIFEEQGYNGFHAENWFWESIISFLFFDELLMSTSIPDNYYLCFDRIKKKTDKRVYFCKLVQIQGKSNLYKFLKKQRQKYKKTIFMPETTRRYQEYCKTEYYLKWFKILTSAIERDKFIRLIDWCIESPGRIVSSMPDLMLFKKGQLFFAEVKSENDKLSSAQLSTLKFLSTDLGIEVYIFEAKEKLSVINQEQKNKFLEYHQQKNIKKKELKKEIEKLTGIKISRKVTYLDLAYRDEINLSAYIKLIECFHKLGYHWISFPLFREIPSKILSSNAKDIKKLNLNEIRDLGCQLKFVRDNSIVEKIVCECKKYINIKLFKAS